MTTLQEQKMEKALHDLMRRVFQIQRRPSEIEEAAAAAIPPLAGGAGPWPWDYLISDGYTGVELAEFTVFGHTYKVCSTIQIAVTDANTNRQTANQDSSFFITPGTYLVGAIILLTPPTLGGYHFYGAGQRESIIQASVSSITLIQAGTPLADPVASFRDLGFADGGNSSVKFFDFGIGMEWVVENCWIQTGNSGIGIDLGLDTRASKIRHNLFDASGSGTHILGSGAIDGEITDNTFHQGTIAVDINNCVGIHINDNRFFQPTTAIRFAGNSFDNFSTVNDNLFWVGTKGIEFINGNQQGLTIENNVFDNLGSGEVGIDFDPLTSAICAGIAITGNVFSSPSSSTAIGIRGDVVNLFSSIASHNIFRAFTSGLEIVNWAGNGNEAYHNLSTTILGVKQALADIGSPVGHSILSGSSAGEGISISAEGIISVRDIHSNSRHHAPDTTLLSGTFAIDSLGIKTITTPHFLGYIPAGATVQLTVIEQTVVDDWSFDLLKIVSVDASNVVAKIRVSTASGSGGAVARLAIQIAGSPTYESVFFGWSETPSMLPSMVEQYRAYRDRRYGSVQAPFFASMLTLSLAQTLQWLEQSPDIIRNRRYNAVQSQNYVGPLI